MNNKINFCINFALLSIFITSLFLPIDGFYICTIDFCLCILIIIAFIIEYSLERDKKIMVLFSVQIIFIFIPLFVFSKNYICLNIKLFLLTLPITTASFINANKIFKTEKILRTILFLLLSIIFVKTLFFIPFYKFSGSQEGFEDIRAYSENGQYKVISLRKLKNKNPITFTSEDYDSIKFLLNNSCWLKENYPEYSNDIPEDISRDFIKEYLKYHFSYELYGGILDVYKLSLPLKNRKRKISIYFPKGEIFLSDESLTEYKNYYPDAPKKIADFFYDGLDIPFNQEWYKSNIDY